MLPHMAPWGLALQPTPASQSSLPPPQGNALILPLRAPVSEEAAPKKGEDPGGEGRRSLHHLESGGWVGQKRQADRDKGRDRQADTLSQRPSEPETQKGGALRPHGVRKLSESRNASARDRTGQGRELVQRHKDRLRWAGGGDLGVGFPRVRRWASTCIWGSHPGRCFPSESCVSHVSPRASSSSAA